MSRGNLALALFLLVALMYLPMGMSDGDTGILDIHSMTVYLDSSESSDYEYMTWDFGDGTHADSRDDPGALNPSHTYAKTGTYVIRQTVYNSFEDGSQDSQERTVRILGPPTVTLMSGDSVFLSIKTEDRTSPEYNPAAEPPEVPEDGSRLFLGWVTDEGDPYDWDSPVDRPLTLHALWSDPDTSGNGDGPRYLLPSAVAAATIAGIVSLVIVVRRS